MANFSSALKITDVNDFIAPSQDCVVLDQSKASLKLTDIDDTEVWWNCIQNLSIFPFSYALFDHVDRSSSDSE